MLYAESQTSTNIANNLFDAIVDPLVALMAFIAILALVVMVIRYIWKIGGDSSNRKQGLKDIWKAILGLFIVVSIWTVFYFIGNLAGTDINFNKTDVNFGTYIIEPVDIPVLKADIPDS